MSLQGHYCDAITDKITLKRHKVTFEYQAVNVIYRKTLRSLNWRICDSMFYQVLQRTGGMLHNYVFN